MENGSVYGFAAAGASIRDAALLHIRTANGLSYGANQSWYPMLFGRMGGCGPTTASNILWYLTASRPETCGGLFDGDAREQAEMLRLMRAVWRYIKPGMRGVDKPSMLADGALRYAQRRGAALSAEILDIPQSPEKRPSRDRVLEFLSSAFADDLPAAFLNLSNGTLANLESWHWVTLISVDPNMQAEMYDQSRRQHIDLAQWLLSTTIGGAFVILRPKP